MLNTTTALILAGGFGTRLQSVVKDVPKPMATVCGKPFLHYVFLYLRKQGIKKVVLLTGYKHEIISAFFGKSYCNIQVEYSVETEPLGTGGAVLQAMSAISQDFFLINGDTFFNVHLPKMESAISNKNVDVCLALSLQKNFDRYGTVQFDAGKKIIAFKEKKFVQEGWINGGVYWIKHQLFENIKCNLNVELPKKFSFETEVLEAFTNKLNFYAFEQEGYFIDIGVPEDYQRAQNEFPKMFESL